MKRIVSIVLMLCLLMGCSTEGKQTEEIELTVFAAASLTEALSKIEKLYQEEEPNVKLVFNFDSSGTLRTQIQEGAVCDIFISASANQMNDLSNILEKSRIELLENKVALAVSTEGKRKVSSFENLLSELKAGDLQIAIGNDDVPVGQYTKNIFEYYEIDETTLEKEGKITYASNVKEIITQVSEAVVDCGIVYATDAYLGDLVIVDTATSEMCGQVIYPAAILSGSEYLDAAQSFLDYLQGQAASDVFESIGFTPLSK